MSLNSELKSRKVLQRGTVCAIGTCKNVNSVTKANEATKHIMYHRFPRDAQLRKAWVLKTGRIDEFNPNFARICSIHFRENEDFETNERASLQEEQRANKKVKILIIFLKI